jgi:rfaE bifunctional protein kinase chain/domain
MTIALSRQRVAELLEKVTGLRIAVIGDAMLDVYLAGDVDRISPEAPVPVVRVRNRSYALGGAANVAQNVLALGAHCDLVGVVGRDAAGERLRTMLSESGGNLECLITVDRCSTQKTRILARSQQLVRIDEEEDAELAGEEMASLLRATHAAIESADALVLEDYNKGVLVERVIREAIAAAIARGIPVVVDPKFRNFFLYRDVTVFKPNRRELEAALGAGLDVKHPAELIALVHRLSVENLLLTLGERGMVLVSREGGVVEVPTVAREVYDVVGAGDTVTAYLAAVLAAGGTMTEAAIIANIAAGIEVGKLGAATVSRRELLDYVDTHELHS